MKMIDGNEAHFDFEELFFSRTTPTGIILSGNSIFRRISGYEWHELLKKPHSLIRHADMPRGVFFLFWQTIQAGQPIGAYVKNQAKDGSFYWVFALALPLEDGYVSIRMKPSSPTFALVQGEYQKLLNIEKSKKLTPEQSAQALLQVLQSLGFENYSTFMVKAFLDELNSRQEKLGRDPVYALTKLNQILEQAKGLRDQSQALAKTFAGNALMPLNLIVQSAKLQEVGDPLAVVAGRYKEMSDEIQNEFSRFEESTHMANQVVEKCQYTLSAAILQTEVIALFETENDPGPIDVATELRLLREVRARGITESITSLNQLIQEFERFRQSAEKLRSAATGLDIVRLTGKVEVARLSGGQEQLNHLIIELKKFKDNLDASIRDASQVGFSIQNVSREIVTRLKRNQLMSN